MGFETIDSTASREANDIRVDRLKDRGFVM